MSVLLWSGFNSSQIENIVTANNLNYVKVILNSINEGYSVYITINGQVESMTFDYSDTIILDAIDYGFLPTTIFSAICEAKEEYMYDDKVIVEVTDQRYFVNDDVEVVPRKSFCLLRLTDNITGKITGIAARDGDFQEEQGILSRRIEKLNINVESEDDDDGYGFMNKCWFQENAANLHVSRVKRLKESLNWNDKENGFFRCRSDKYLSLIKTKKLKKIIKNDVLVNVKNIKKEYNQNWRIKYNFDNGFDDMLNILENQKQTIFNLPTVNTPIYDSCRKECVHKMIIRSPLSGSNFRLILTRCGLHNQHWGHLTVDQWEGCSSQPIYFSLPGGYEQGRLLLEQLSDMLRAARVSTTTTTATATTTTTNITTNANSNTTSTTIPTTLIGNNQPVSIINPATNIVTVTSLAPPPPPPPVLSPLIQTANKVTYNTTTNTNNTNIKRVYPSHNILPASLQNTSTGIGTKFTSNFSDNSNVSLENLMTHSIQTGKLLYDNRDILPNTNTMHLDSRKSNITVTLPTQMLLNNNGPIQISTAQPSLTAVSSSSSSAAAAAVSTITTNNSNNNPEMMLMINTTNSIGCSTNNIIQSTSPSNQSGIVFSKQFSDDTINPNSNNKYSYYSMKDLSLDDLF